MKKSIIGFCLIFVMLFGFQAGGIKEVTDVQAKGVLDRYYTVYDVDNAGKVVFVKGEGVNSGDQYISGDNKLYEVVEVDEKAMSGKAKFVQDVQLPVVSVKRKADTKEVSALTRKKVGMYHTHNDECYVKADGTDSVYGKGGIHDVGAKLKKELEGLNVDVVYSENLHLPHNSGAYTRSQTTASNILDKGGISAIFDIHRDATPKSEYDTKVNGKSMTKVRMVVGAANQNSAENKDFAYNIKAYADEVYPGLIKDIYIGKGNYNQQLSPRAMLFEMGCHNSNKEDVLRSTVPLAKTIDMVLFGSQNASAQTLEDVSLTGASGQYAGMAGLAGTSSKSSVSFVWILLGGLAFYGLVLGLLCAFNKDVRYKTKRFFSEMTVGLFGKQKRKNK